VPFTTGILIGIGETLAERIDALREIRRISRAYGGIQEVIVQNFRAKPDTAMRDAPDAGPAELAATIAVARLLLGPGARIQAPPNLVGEEFALMLRAGIDDWGGVSPVSGDHVNPERPWPVIEELAAHTAAAGFTLRERLTVYPEHLRRGEPWLDPRLTPHVAALADPATGLAAEGALPRGLPWQEPETPLVATGRTDLFAAIDTDGRTTDRRADFDSVYGDWSAVARAVPEAARASGRTGEEGSVPSGGARPERLRPEFAAALWAAQADPAGLASASALTLLGAAPGAEIEALAGLADDLRTEAAGDEITYVVTRNINFTNVCYTGCRFCAFAQRRTDADAYTLSLEQVGDRVDEAWAAGATEICMQGGIHPDLPGTAYFDLAREVKQRQPGIHLHAFSPMEIVNGAARTGLSFTDFLTAAKEAGLDSIPGTAAEILDDDVRWVLTKGKLPTKTWIEIVTTAHRVGIRSSSTMMYGHVDNPRHWVQHLRVLSRIQDETGGFTEFVPLPFVHNSAPIYLAGVARPGPSLRDNLAVHAMARIMLHGRIDNIQTSWVKLGVDGTRAMLKAGANDLGGTLMEETISRMAGSEHGSAKTVAELGEIGGGIGRPVVERTTTYGRR
jgi:FO synthase